MPVGESEGLETSVALEAVAFDFDVVVEPEAAELEEDELLLDDWALLVEVDPAEAAHDAACGSCTLALISNQI